MPKLTKEQLTAKYDAMYEYENDCLSKGFRMIGGIDEAGDCGPTVHHPFESINLAPKGIHHADNHQ